MGSIIYNGHEIQDLIINGNQAQLWLNGQKLYPSATVDPYNPLGLPPYTIRCKFSSAGQPSPGHPEATWDSVTPVDTDGYIWDITKNSTDWRILLYDSNVIDVLGANTTGVTNMQSMLASNYLQTVSIFDTSSCTNMSYMFNYCRSLTSVPLFDTSSCTSMDRTFQGCTSLTTVPLFDTSSCTVTDSMFEGCSSLTSVPLFDTSNVVNIALMFQHCSSLISIPLFDTSSVTNMYGMFDGCESLTTVPLFDTSSCTNMGDMFYGCVNVQSGALALYQQASTQANPPWSHGGAFYQCGSLTVTGAAELAQIPQDWGGTRSATEVDDDY